MFTLTGQCHQWIDWWLQHEADCCDSDTLTVHYHDWLQSLHWICYMLWFSRWWLEWSGVLFIFFLRKKNKQCSLFVTLSIPHSFLPAAAHRGPVFSRCALGSDLITYLFALSYSKLHSLCVLLRAETFLPPVLLSAFHPASWLLTGVTALASRRSKFVFSQLLCSSQFCWPTPLSLHRSQVTYLQRPVIVSRGVLKCPPPIVTCYKSVSVALWVYQRSK